MMKKQISKISMMASLLVATMVNAQEFYTCVPKKNTCDNSLKFSNIDELKQAIADGVAQGMKNSGTANNNNSSSKVWNFIKKIDLSYIELELDDYTTKEMFITNLEPGKYKIKCINAENGFIEEELENFIDFSYYTELALSFRLDFTCSNDLPQTPDKVNISNVKYITPHNKCKSWADHNGSVVIRIKDVGLFLYDFSDKEKNIVTSKLKLPFKRSYLEIYKKNDD